MKQEARNNGLSRSRRSWNNVLSYLRQPAHIILIVFAVFLTLSVLLPLLSLLRDSLTIHIGGEATEYGLSVGSWTFVHWFQLLFNSEYNYSIICFWKPLLNSTLMALVACLVAVGFGGALAWLVTRTNLPFKKFISIVFVFPYIMPSWSIAMFWENFFKNSTVAAAYNQVGMLEAITHITVPEWCVYGFFPCAMCLGIHYAPFAYILIGGVLRNMDANLEEAATILKASRFKILRKITLPIVKPAIVSTILLVFASSISSYTVPAFLNKNGSFATISITMTSLLNQSTTKGMGYALAIVLLLLSVVILAINSYITSRRSSFTTVTGKSGQVSLINLKKKRYVIGTIAVIIVGFFAIVPLFSFAFESLLAIPGSISSFTWYYWITPDQIETRVAGDSCGILRNATIWKAIGGSLLLSTIVALVAGTSGILIGYAVSHKRGSRFANYVSNLAFFPYLIPSLSFGAIYFAISYMNGFSWLHGTMFLLIIVGSIKFLPFASKTGTNAMLQVSGEIEEAAIIEGIPWWKRMVRILFPIQKSSFISGYLLPFTSCMRELTLFVLIAGAGSIITVVLQNFEISGVTQISNGINLIIILIVIGVNLLVNKVTGASIDKGIGG